MSESVVEAIDDSMELCLDEMSYSLKYPDGVVRYSWGVVNNAIYLSAICDSQADSEKNENETAFWTAHQSLYCSRTIVADLYRVFSEYQNMKDDVESFESRVLTISENYRKCFTQLFDKFSPSESIKTDELLIGLMEWIGMHHAYRLDKQTQELLFSYSSPELIRSYWPAVYQFAIRGMFTDVSRMLHLHLGVSSMEHMNVFTQVIELSETYPMPQKFTNFKSFESSWIEWVNKVYAAQVALVELECDKPPGLNNLLLIYCGDEAMIKKYSKNWVHFLMAIVLFKQPHVQRDNISLLIESVLDSIGKKNYVPIANLNLKIDTIIRNIFDLEFEKVVYNVSKLEKQQYFKAHFIDLLHTTKIWSVLGIDESVHTNALLEYSLYLWNFQLPLKIIFDYLRCNHVSIKHYLSLYIKKSQLRCEQDAYYLLKLCKDYEIEECYGVQKYIKRVMVQLKLQSNNLASALTWAEDQQASEKLTEELLERLVIPLNSMENASDDDNSAIQQVQMMLDTIRHTNNLFLTNYHKLLIAHSERNWDLASKILFRLITSTDTPKKFLLCLINDCYYVCKSGNIILCKFTALELMKHIQELLVSSDKKTLLESFGKLCSKFSLVEQTSCSNHALLAEQRICFLKTFLAKALASSILQSHLPINSIYSSYHQ